LDWYQGAVLGGVGVVVAVDGVPGDQDAVAERAEGHGAFDGVAGAVAGLFDAQDVFGFQG
jgi:hypothetical protein